MIVRGHQTRWTALRDGESAGELRAIVRPDQRWYLFFGDMAPDAHGPLLAAATAVLHNDLYVEADENDVPALTALAEHGFTENRREHRYVVPTEPARTSAADGFDVISAADADPDRWRLLDDALRHEVPGVGGWRNDPDTFAAATFADPEFDPALYLLAVDGDRYAGLVRVWNRPGRPRLGLIGTLPDYRRRGLARALLAQAFAVLHKRGHAEVSCEVDETNTASNALLTGVGARREGGGVELVRTALSPPEPPSALRPP